MKRALSAFGVLLVAASPVHAAGNIDQINLLSQTQFRELAEDMGAALSYKALTPATPLGITGFDLGIEATATKIQNTDAWDRAISGSAPNTVYLPKLHAHKGLPAGFDVGAFYSSVPNSNIRLWGAELRYAILGGGALEPALGVRGTYTKLSGVDQIDFHTTGLELTLSKGFPIFTPYAGLGRVWSTAEPVGVPTLSKEDFGQEKYFVGGNFNFGLANLALEADKTGGATSYGLKLGFRF